MSSGTLIQSALEFLSDGCPYEPRVLRNELCWTAVQQYTVLYSMREKGFITVGCHGQAARKCVTLTVRGHGELDRRLSRACATLNLATTTAKAKAEAGENACAV